MGEFRFPSPRGDLPSNEVTFTLSDGVLPPSTPLLLGIPTVKMVTNPNLVTRFTYDTGVNAGKVYHPTLLPDSNKGLVLACQGGFNGGGTPAQRAAAYLTVFEDLCTTLASNGFVVVCLRHVPGTGSEIASNEILNTLKYALEDPDDKFSQFKLKGRPIALVGHSEGGRGAILTAQRVVAGEISHLVKKITAVVGFAPTQISPVKNFTNALLIMQGTHDGDAPAGGKSMRIYESAIVPSKYFLWIHGGTHSRFLQTPLISSDSKLNSESDADLASRIQLSTQLFITKNYVTMFLLFQLAADVKYRPVFIGDADVEWKAPFGPISADIITKRFRALPLYDESMGAPVAQDFIVEQMFQDNLVRVDENHPLKIDHLRDLHFSLFEHSVQGSVVQWNRNLKNSTAPKFTVVCNKVVMALSPKFIEFQAILTARSPENPGPPPQPAATVAVTLKSGNNKSLPVTVVIERSIDLDSIEQGFNLNISRGMLSTIRIPISRFGSLPAGFLASADLLLDFSVPPSKTGRLALANFRVSWS